VSQEAVDFVSGVVSASADMDKRAMLAALPELVPRLCDPDVEWVEDPQRADARTYRGHDGVIDSWRLWLEQWDEYGFEVEQIVDCGAHVLVASRERARGASSGASVDARHFGVWTVRDGKLLRYREFYDEQAARAAAGCA
jgi:ketosteroid isomerase-like protein